jgi:hypothetical protein
MKAYIFLSVHEELFHRVALRLREHGVTQFCGFAWGHQQAEAISNRGIAYDPMLVFSRDLLPLCDDGTPPDVGWLERRERELGVSLARMIAAERHLLKGRTYTQIQRMVEVALKQIGAALDRARPDFLYSEDVSCLHSLIHYALAQERGIKFYRISTGRIPNRLSVYATGFQRLERANDLYREIAARGITEAEREQADDYIARFRERPARMPAMALNGQTPRIRLNDLRRVSQIVRHYFGDPKNPTTTPPIQAIKQRVRRIARVHWADRAKVFERPVAGENYVFYPLHFQPEASTLVQAPLYLDQVALLQDIARSLPIGHRLYIKEHVSSRGRRPVSYYRSLRLIEQVRLLSPDEDTWTLIREASAVAVITGTAGWEGLLFDKPVVTFGDAFFNILPHVYRASAVPKDGWYDLFRRAIFEHRPDHNALRAFVAAMHRGSFPGTILNPTRFPHVLEDGNVENIALALATRLSLDGFKATRAYQ